MTLSKRRFDRVNEAYNVVRRAEGLLDFWKDYQDKPELTLQDRASCFYPTSDTGSMNSGFIHIAGIQISGSW